VIYGIFWQKIKYNFLEQKAEIMHMISLLCRKAHWMILGCSIFTLSGCGFLMNKDTNKKLTHLEYTVSEAPKWTALFNRDSGWLGGDGIFAIPMRSTGEKHKTDSVLFVFSDTVIGEIVNGKLKPGFRLVHNSVAKLKGVMPEKGRFYYASDKKGKPRTMFTPSTSHAEEGDYYWLGDGFVNKALDNKVFIFAYRMHNEGSGAWSFKQKGTTLIVLQPGSKPPFKNQKQIETPFIIKGSDTGNGTLGAGIFANTESAAAPHPDGYIYVYGVKGKAKSLFVGRVLPENIKKFDLWRFWDGENWVKGMKQAAVITDSVSNELSVSPMPDGRYALVFQVNGMSNTVGLRLGLSPYGPFGPIIKVWNCKEPQHKNYYTYNAKAYPALSKKGELLISYNVNAFHFLDEIKKNPHLYRPRFVKIEYK